MKRILPGLFCLAGLLAAASCAPSYRASDSSADGTAGSDIAPPEGTPAAPAQDDSIPIGIEVRLRPVTAFIVRHAEAGQDGTGDPALTEAGRRRAIALRERLRGEEIVAIYSSPYRRTRDTAAPLAQALGIEVREYDPRDAQALAAELFLHQRGRRTLIVGHSNTVPAAVEALGGERPPDLAHAEHDALFVVEADGTALPARVTRLTYGAPSDTTTAP